MFVLTYSYDYLKKSSIEEKINDINDEIERLKMNVDEIDYEVDMLYRRYERLSDKAEKYYDIAGKKRLAAEYYYNTAHDLFCERINLSATASLLYHDSDELHKLAKNEKPDDAKETYEEAGKLINHAINLIEITKDIEEDEIRNRKLGTMKTIAKNKCKAKANKLYERAHMLFNTANDYVNVSYQLTEHINKQVDKANKLYNELDKMNNMSITSSILSIFGIC